MFLEILIVFILISKKLVGNFNAAIFVLLKFKDYCNFTVKCINAKEQIANVSRPE